MDQNLQVKLLLHLHIVAEAQKKGGAVAYIDAEHALRSSYAKIRCRYR